MEQIIRIIYHGKGLMIVKARIKIKMGIDYYFCDGELCDLSNLCRYTLGHPCDKINYELPENTRVRCLIVIKPRLFISSYLKHNKLI